MRVLDDEGRVFGRVNVVDAVVVVAGLALLVGGAFVVLGDVGGGPGAGPGEQPVDHAIVSYDVPLDSPAARLSSGAEFGPVDGGGSLTDVHRSTTPNGTAHVTAVLEYRGSFAVDGIPKLAGDEATLPTDAVRVRAQVRAVDLDAATVDTSARSLVLFVDPPTGVASAVEAGDEVHVADDVVATVESVERAEDGGTLVGATVTARETAAGPAFGGRLVRVGNHIGLVTDEAVVRGRVVALGTSDAGDVDE